MACLPGEEADATARRCRRSTLLQFAIGPSPPPHADAEAGSRKLLPPLLLPVLCSTCSTCSSICRVMRG